MPRQYSQTYQNIGLICVNDGSSDYCGQISEKYDAMDERLLIIAQKNRDFPELETQAAICT